MTGCILASLETGHNFVMPYDCLTMHDPREHRSCTCARLYMHAHAMISGESLNNDKSLEHDGTQKVHPLGKCMTRYLDRRCRICDEDLIPNVSCVRIIDACITRGPKATIYSTCTGANIQKNPLTYGETTIYNIYSNTPPQTQGGSRTLSLESKKSCCARVCAFVKKSANCKSEGT